MMRAPPPPALQKPQLPYAGVARGGTFPRRQKLIPTAASDEASSQAASSVALNQAVPTRQAPPPPPQRKGSLKSLNSLRRARAVPEKIESKIDLSTQFLTEHDLWKDDERFVTYV